MKKAYRLIIGSVGDESHSVGIAFLTLAFREEGFFVKNFGILNTLDDLFHTACNYDAILISCINGHADLYLEDFPEKLHHFELTDTTPRLWYLGGNLSVKEKNETVVRKYRRMGFDFVSPKPIPWKQILINLLKDFHNKGIHKKEVKSHMGDDTPLVADLDTVNDDKMADEQFQTVRKEVLASWPTGAEVWDADITGNHSDPEKNLNRVIVNRQASEYRPLIQPRTGVSHVKDEIEILHFLRKSGLDISSIQLDAACRKNMYYKAAEGVTRTEKGKRSFLNGYPLPVHGVRGMEEIMEAIDNPFQIRAGSPDHRLTYEIGLAGGASSVEGGFICYLFPYDKKTSPVTCYSYWKYVDKLADWYNQNYGIVINREYFGALTTSLIEPTIPIVINIVQAVLSAKSGVKCISVGLAEQGNRSQDIAAIRVLENTTRGYLAKYGFQNCTVSTVFHQYMAAFPTDLEKASEMILNSSITGTLAKATRFMTKTPVESIHIPTKEDNSEGLRLTRMGILKATNIKPDMDEVDTETRILNRQVSAIMDSIEILGEGSLARGAIRAFQEGILDIPFSPSIYNRSNLITARDRNGAIRFVNPELLPFDEDVVEFHKEKIHQRMVMERLSKNSDILERDLTRIWKNDYERWPLDGHYIS